MTENTLNYKEKTGFSSSLCNFDIEGGELNFVNETKSEIIVVIENTDRNEEAVIAADVSSLQLFRDLFANEVLAADQQIGVENITILFSDLQGSTSLYDKVDDAKAYKQVYNHFEYMKKWTTFHNGSFVKTIGDSVMAVFYKPAEAVAAALAIQCNIKQYNIDHKTADEIIIKIGIYSGPAIAVNANGVLDYFGHTVNIAARLQQQSKGNDVMLA